MKGYDFTLKRRAGNRARLRELSEIRAWCRSFSSPVQDMQPVEDSRIEKEVAPVQCQEDAGCRQSPFTAENASRLTASPLPPLKSFPERQMSANSEGTPQLEAPIPVVMSFGDFEPTKQSAAPSSLDYNHFTSSVVACVECMLAKTIVVTRSLGFYILFST